MKRFLQSDFFRETVCYLFVGIIATLISFALQFFFTTVLLMNYVPSSIYSFLLSSPVSFFLHRRFTFHAEKLPLGTTMLRFYVILIPCFALSYLVLQPGFDWLFNQFKLTWPQQYITYAKQLAANCVFVVMNYTGQKFFAFKKPKQEPKA